MIYYDSHAHTVDTQTGGFLIGIEGYPILSGFLTNNEVCTICSGNRNFLPCYYISNQWNDVPDETILKYHPRREKYSYSQVIDDIEKRNCKICIIDTLNQPYWSYLDYWKIIGYFPKVTFILPHMGGYDIADFVKILDFNKNVYADFSMTQEYFGWCGNRTKYHIVSDCIDYCLTNPKLNKKILFGSDTPDFSQSLALNKYSLLPNANDILRDNYLSLINNVL